MSPDTSEEPWKEDGRSWHLEERSNEETADLLEQVVAALEDIEFLDGPEWGQKIYLSFKQDRKIRIAIRTKRTLFHVDVYDVSLKQVEIKDIATAIGIPDNDIRAEENLRSSRRGVRITCRAKEEVDLEALSDQVRQLLTSQEDT